ncbi:hypothetical protein DIPPA_02348 [Diplonema papillatum]|nr:hypothetical protein DIPPA_02348 [Diplonema papillatum]
MKILLCFSGYGRRGEGGLKVVLPETWVEYVGKVTGVASHILGVPDCPVNLLKMVYLDVAGERCAITKPTFDTFCEDLVERKSAQRDPPGTTSKVYVTFLGDRSAAYGFPELPGHGKAKREQRRKQHQRTRQMYKWDVVSPSSVDAFPKLGDECSLDNVFSPSGGFKQGQAELASAPSTASNSSPPVRAGVPPHLCRSEACPARAAYAAAATAREESNISTNCSNSSFEPTPNGKNDRSSSATVGYSAPSTPCKQPICTPGQAGTAKQCRKCTACMSDASFPSPTDSVISPVHLQPFELMLEYESAYEVGYTKICSDERRRRKDCRLAQQFGSLVISLVDSEQMNRNSIESECNVQLQQLMYRRTLHRPPTAPRGFRRHVASTPQATTRPGPAVPTTPSPPYRRVAPSSAPAGGRARDHAPHPPVLPADFMSFLGPADPFAPLGRQELEERAKLQFLADTEAAGLEAMHTRLWIQAVLAESRRELEIEQGHVMAMLNEKKHEATPGGGRATDDGSDSGSPPAGDLAARDPLPEATADKGPPPPLRALSVSRTGSLSGLADWPRNQHAPAAAEQPAPAAADRDLERRAAAIAPMLQAVTPFLLWPLLRVMPNLAEEE